jgi:hypothetical protein
MKKWIFIGLGAVVVILIVIVVIGLSKLGPIVKMAVNTYGPRITGTELKVDDVGISLFSGEAKLKNFFLGNPKGFKSASAMKVGSVYVHVDEGSLTKDPIVIEKVEVVAPEITYEKKGGTDNFQALLANVQKNVPQGQSAQKEPEKKGPGKQLVIKDLVIKQGRVNLALDMPGVMLGDRQISTDLPEIQLKNIGEQKGGSSPTEVAKEIFAALYAKITAPNVIGALNDQLKNLGGNAAKALESVTQEGFKGAAGVVEGAGKEAGSVTDKVKGLFQKKD